MAESQQSKRGWFNSWREQRRAKRQDVVEREFFMHEQVAEFDGMHRRSSAYQHSGPVTYWTGFGGDGGCGGDGGGGGGC